MRWASLDDVSKKIDLPTGYRLEHLKRKEVEIVTGHLKNWYPDIVVGSESCHLNPAFYYNDTYLLGEEDSRSVLPVILRHDSEIVAIFTLKKDSDSRVMTGRLGVIAPSHRGKGLAYLVPWLGEGFGRAMGAGVVYYFVTLRIPHQQIVAEKSGFRLVGIVPAFDRDMVSPGVVKHVYEGIYAKVLAPEDQIILPPVAALTPETKKLWDLLFNRSQP